MLAMLCGAVCTLPTASAAAQKKGERVRVLAGSVLRTAPGGQVIGVLSRAYEAPAEMVQGSAVRLRITGFVSEKAVRLESNRRRGLIGGSGANGGVLRTGPGEKEPELAKLRRGAVVFSGATSSTFLAVNRTVWVDKSRLATFTAPGAAASKPPKGGVRAPAPTTAKISEKPVLHSVPGSTARAETNPLSTNELSAADLRADPRGTKGRVVRWTVEALSYQLADGLRRELNGEPYLLARGPGKERAILYLAVPDSLVAAARALAPLTTITVTARVRSGKSEPGGAPILDLLELVRR